MTVTLIIIGLLLLPVLYNLSFPFKRPLLDNYFLPGQTFISKAEGVTQTFIRQDGNKVYCELKFNPNAIGPPEHLHTNLDEHATVIKGTLTIKVGGHISKLNQGDRLCFKRGIYHRMYNETNEVVIVRSEKNDDYVPAEFAYSLAQLYPLMKSDGGLSLKMFAKICVLDELFDSAILGTPPAFFNLIKKIIKPYARLFGVTPYDDKSRPK
ncbi:MAG: cupin domain-containing protein [Balneolaceae bacterium]